MSPKTVDRFVETHMKRVMDGDDEALNVLILELRPLALELIPAAAARHQVYAEQITSQAIMALYEALMLWSPVRGRFVWVLEARVRSRVGHFLLGLRDMVKGVAA